jgi:acyl-CoA synthetase (AMP-forming)/AMP-acid ligase II
MLLEMVGDGLAERVAIGSRSGGWTFAELAVRAKRAASWLRDAPGGRIVLIDLNSEAIPLCLFGGALAGKPFVPVNYRLTDDQLRAIVARTAPATVIAGDGIAERIAGIEGIEIRTRQSLLDASAEEDREQLDGWSGDSDEIAVLLFTSGTTGEPKAAVLRHRNLASYVVGSVEFGGSSEDDAAIVSVPPYHIAGISAVISSAYGGRRVVYLESFEPAQWVQTVRAEGITHAMVVPTMLTRILDIVEEDGLGLPSLRALSYGGGPMPLPVIERAMRLLPGVGFVNAYGLTETSSTVAVLGPDDHREAFASSELSVRSRLASVGKPLPSIEVSVRDPFGDPVGAGERGEIWVRGEQVSGEYLGKKLTDDDGWFNTRDSGSMDDGGYLFVHGRLDDVIVRGGENLSPGEIEAVMLDYPGVAAAAVVGVPDVEWGEKVVAAVVLDDGASVTEAELQEFIRSKLRSTRTPERIEFRSELPFNETGKLLRRVLREELAAN